MLDFVYLNHGSIPLIAILVVAVFYMVQLWFSASKTKTGYWFGGVLMGYTLLHFSALCGQVLFIEHNGVFLPAKYACALILSGSYLIFSIHYTKVANKLQALWASRISVTLLPLFLVFAGYVLVNGHVIAEKVIHHWYWVILAQMVFAAALFLRKFRAENSHRNKTDDFNKKGYLTFFILSCVAILFSLAVWSGVLSLGASRLNQLAFFIINLCLISAVVYSFVHFGALEFAIPTKLVGVTLVLVALIFGIESLVLWPEESLQTFSDVQLSGHKLAAVSNYEAELSQMHAEVIPWLYLLLGSSVLVLVVFPLIYHSDAFLPIQRLLYGMKRLQAGDLEAPIEIPQRNELGQVAHYVNDVIHELNTRNEKLQRYSRELEERVEARTVEMNSRKEDLEQTKNLLEKQTVELERLNELKTRFFLNVSHELRTPLTLIKGPAAYLLKDPDLKEENRHHLARIYRNTRRLSQLIEQILDLNRLDAGKLSLSAQRVNICLYLRYLVESFSSLMVTKGIKYDFNIPAREIYIYVDPDKLEKIITNLITNAAKFTHPKGRVTVELREEGKEVVISVEDTGVGIKKAKRDKIFARFETRADNDHSYKEGLGIGLSITSEYMRLHGGRIEVDSEEGKGSRFELVFKKGKGHLPEENILADTFEIREAFVKEPLILDRGKRSTGNRYRVLLIEDSQEMGTYISDLLNNYGYDVLEAYNGDEGLRMAKTYQPDIIISDIMMPVMDGFQLLEELRKDKSLQQVPTIFLTALSGIENRLKSLRFGVNDYINKPFNSDELLVRIRNLLHFSEMRTKRSESSSSKEAPLCQLFGDEEFIQRLVSWVEGRMDSGKLTTEELAHAMNMSRRTLYREIKKHTGFTAAGFLKEVRLQYARHLAEKGELVNLAELCDRVGYGSTTYFRNEFVARFGREPFD